MHSHFFVYSSGGHRDLHVLTHSFPTRRSSDLVADVAFTLHGVTRIQSIVMAAVRDGDSIKTDGRFALRQSDFGIAPFSILGGALAVDDVLAISFTLQLQRAH